MARLGAGLSIGVVALIVATVLLLALGQVLFKTASVGMQLARPMSMLSWSLFAALVIYGVATMMWLLVLSKVPLSVAFGFYGLNFVIVPMFSWWLLSEPLKPQVLVGGCVIMIGIIITTIGRDV